MSKNRNLWNLLYLILAIVVAAGIWFYVDEHSDRTVSVTVTNIPIEYTNQESLADNGLMLLEGARTPPWILPLRENGGTLCSWTAPRSG